MFEKIKAILLDNMEDDDIEITMDSVLVDDLGLSSLEVISIVTAVEDEFGIEVPDQVIPTFRTVSDIMTYLEKNVE